MSNKNKRINDQQEKKPIQFKTIKDWEKKAQILEKAYEENL